MGMAVGEDARWRPGGLNSGHSGRGLIVIGRGSSDVGLGGDGSLGDDGWWYLRRRRGRASY
ncbi:PAS domain S-box protein [Sesbania bispinosa]|nr:PAS domain S-box protein [Sesbania bispinosa]